MSLVAPKTIFINKLPLWVAWGVWYHSSDFILWHISSHVRILWHVRFCRFSQLFYALCIKTTPLYSYTTRCYSMKTLSKFRNFDNFHGVMTHHGAYSSFWRTRRTLCAGLPADPLRKNSLIATWAFPSTSWGSQVFIQSPSIPPEIRCCRTRRSTSA